MVRELSDIQKWIGRDDIIIDVVSLSDERHPASTNPCMVFLKKVGDTSYQLIPIDSYDHAKSYSKKEVESFFSSISNKIYCISKKKLLHLLKIEKVLDLSVKVFVETGEIIDEYDYNTNTHVFFNNKYKNHGEINKIIPYTVHGVKFLDICKDIEPHISNKNDTSYYDINKVVLETLQKIESNGIHIDENEFAIHFPDKQHLVSDSTVYTEYNILTATGRPSNRFGSINFAALNKENECRKSFTSRYGSDGILVMFDYSAYHPRIIGKLIRYDFPENVNVYDYLGRYYFKTENLSEDQVKRSKTLTFQQLYGSISEEYLEIPYFLKIHDYVQHRWNYFNEHGYVETPIFKRQISSVHLKDASPSKLFNYILQASETEYSMQILDVITRYLENKKTKAVLYTYDSILFDVYKPDGKDVVLEIKRLMENTGFPTKCYIGKNYHDMQVITI